MRPAPLVRLNCRLDNWRFGSSNEQIAIIKNEHAGCFSAAQDVKIIYEMEHILWDWR
jgi:hypothetical protein